MNLTNTKITIRKATIDDCQLIVDLMKGLGEYENTTEKNVGMATPELIKTNVFVNKYAEILIILVNDAPAGFSCFYHNFSTFLGKPGLWLEDIFVLPEYRRLRLGEKLFNEMAKICEERKCIRFEWICVNWNKPALQFYKRLGAKELKDWSVHRLESDDIKILAGGIKNSKL